MKKEFGIFILLVVLCVVTSVINHRFLSPTNLTNMANIIGLFGIFSIGLGMVIITGGIDLSVGSMFALCGVLLAMALTEWSWPVGSWDVAPREIKDVVSLAGKLKQPADPVSQFLWNQFPGDLRDELTKFNGTNVIQEDTDDLIKYFELSFRKSGESEQTKKLKLDLAAQLNGVIHGPSIYDTNRFASVSLSDQTQKLADSDSQNKTHDKLNRLLLQDTYPDELAVVYQHWPWPLAAALVILIPMALGWVHGLLITRMKIQPFIITLCGLLIYRGLARFIAHDDTKGFGEAGGFETLRHLAKDKLFGLPMPFVILIVVAIIMWFVLHRSIYGRYLLAVGRNEEAARFSGINTRRVIASSYIVSGLLAGISGILFAFYTNSVSPSNHGNFYELYGIAAAVLGGCSLRGGEGSVIGILIGVALLQVLQNLVNLLGIPSSLNFAVMGAVVLIGVLADQIFKNRAAKKTVR
jgi:ribose transport system permease protein